MSYNSLVAFERITDPEYVIRFVDPLVSSRRGLRYRLSIARDITSAARGEVGISNFVTLSERLVLLRVRLNSPGLWTFLGSLNPLEVARKYIQDRHERRQDRDYRENAEERRLHLENAALENKVIRERFELLRDMGVSDGEIASLGNALIYKPLSKLGQYQDAGLIQGAAIDFRSLGSGSPDKL